MKENEISIYKFLYTYLFITNKDLYKITHEDVKILFPYLKRCSFDDVKKNPHLIKDRKVVFVNDGRKTIPYYVNNESRLLRGEAGDGAKITVNGKEESLNTKISVNDIIEIIAI